VWKAQYDVRQALQGHMKVARETPTFIFGDSLDMTGFTDGTGNPEPASQDKPVAVVADGQKGAGGSFFIAQRWVHDLPKFNAQSIPEQEGVFGRTKEGSVRLDNQPAHSHLSHVELRDGATADASKSKRDEMTRRSTPCAQREPNSWPRAHSLRIDPSHLAAGTPSTTAPSASTSSASARGRRRCRSACGPCTGWTGRCPTS
jgi:deferrochelatase/peroxidase EfeB